VNRPVDELPIYVADTLLDFFDITLKPGADVSRFD
jgi:hypothetical protein